VLCAILNALTLFVSLKPMSSNSVTGTLPAGARLDIYRGVVPVRRDAEELPVTQPAGVIRGGAIPQCITFTGDGSSLVVGEC
jgi:hypothetical protein